MIDTLLFIWSLRSIVQMVAFAALIFLAARYGAGPERAAAVIIGLMPVADAVYHTIFLAMPAYQDVEIGHLAIDLITAISLTFIALQANRMYTLWMGAFQLLALQAHLTRELIVQVSPIAYVTMQTLPSYFQIILLGCGIWCHRRRIINHGMYRQWRNCSFLSLRTEQRVLRAA